ncbi:MAG: hypothetical protein U0694_08650 [Anaerolineae bacterium]
MLSWANPPTGTTLVNFVLTRSNGSNQTIGNDDEHRRRRQRELGGESSAARHDYGLRLRREQRPTGTATS